MQYAKILEGKFIDRPNRFIAHVEVGGEVETVHVKNTGRCKELLLPGVNVILEVSSNPNRKTKYDLICVYKEGIGWVNMDSQAPNKVVAEWLKTKDFSYIKGEYKYGKSRIDFYCEKDDKKYLMEVKGVTLEYGGKAYFPDAPTERGVKHIEELAKAIDEGYECAIIFVIQMEGIDMVYPHDSTHPEFGEALRRAKKKGVKIYCLGCEVSKDKLTINRERMVKDEY